MMLVVGVQGVPVFLSFSQSVCHWAQIHYPILACGTGRMMQARRANILNFDDGKDSHNINTKYYLWGKFHIECACHSISYCPNQHTQTMRAPTIVLGLFRIGAYLLTPASSFQAHHHHPSAAAASVLRDGGAIITGTKSKGASAPSNRDDEEVDRSRKTRWRRHRSSSDLRCWWRVSSRRRPRTRAGGPLPVALICSLVRRVRTVCLTCQ